MSLGKKLQKAVQKLFQELLKLTRVITKEVMNWLLRSFMVLGRRSSLARAGFILPTVVMVILVVTLLVTAIVFRSFDRAKNAGNVRVNERVLAATSPAIDRAKAKINALLADPTLPRGTPSDTSLYLAMTNSLSNYTLGDETPLELVYDFGGGTIGSQPNGTIDTITNGRAKDGLDTDESLKTAWRFPVDTNNNGKFDSYIIYGLYFRSPTPNTSSNLDRAKTPLEVRTPPQDANSGTKGCGAGTAASFVGSSSWKTTSDGNIKKSFYVFATTVPYTTNPPAANFEVYQGSPGFAGLEYEQDQERIPLTNNTIVYNDDLEITPGSGIKLNGRIMTNGNLILGQVSNPVHLYQVSSTNSCFYSQTNGQVVVGGNVMVGSLDSSRTGIAGITVDLFSPTSTPTPATFGTGEASVSGTAVKASFNSQAYADRINYLVGQNTNASNDPQEVIDQVKKLGLSYRLTALQTYFQQRTRRVPFAEAAGTTGTANPPAPALQGTTAAKDIRPADLWAFPVDPTGSGTSYNSLQLVNDKPTATDPTTRNDTDKEVGDRISVGNGLPAVWWKQNEGRFVNFYNYNSTQPVGGSVTWKGSSTPRTRKTEVVPLSDLGDTSRDGFWERQAAQPPTRPLDGVGGLRVVTGAGVYDVNNPTTNSLMPRRGSVPQVDPPTDDYSTTEVESVEQNLGAAQLNTGFIVVFPDSMPMWEDTGGAGGRPDGIISPPPDTVPAPAFPDKRGDLVMRATAVYHYRFNSYDDPVGGTNPYPNPGLLDQKPIACVSSYYNPSTSVTAYNSINAASFPGPPGVVPPTAPNQGLSNNGISYQPPTVTPSGIGTGSSNANGVFTTPVPVAPPTAPGGTNWRAVLNYQANLIFPNRRFVNQPLRDALKQKDSGKLLTLAQQAAIDSTLCALQIRSRDISPSSTNIPDGAIYETAFLDGRQVKAIESESPLLPALLNTGTERPSTGANIIVPDYDLSIEERQPLEIRATVLDLDKLRRQSIAGTGTQAVPPTEYLLPDSGIIYATRDDALLDLSAPGSSNPVPTTPPANQAAADSLMAARKLNSPVDFILDSSRRPNGIMLINGSTLARGGNSNSYKPTEKGLILATNLPVYVKADATNGFNLHQTPGGAILEEFQQGQRLIDFSSTGNWSDSQFYNRGNSGPPNYDREPNFACRNGQPGLTCTQGGDLWRPATVLADSVTLLSNNFRFGFRNEGDYDLRKNVDNLSNNLHFSGYDFNNSGNTNAATDVMQGEAAGTAPLRTTAVDLNGNGTTTDTIETVLGIDLDGDGFPNSLNPLNPGVGTMNVAEKDVTAAAARRLNGFYDNSYVTSADSFNNSTGFPKLASSYLNNFVTPIQRRTTYPEYVMEICRKTQISECGPSDWVVNVNSGTNLSARLIPPNTSVTQLRGAVATPNSGAGTTARLPLNPADQRYPRRVAFLRDAQNRLVLDGNARPTPLGINALGNVQPYPYNSPPPPATVGAALWFTGTGNPNNPPAGADYGSNTPLFYQNKLADNGGIGTTQQPLLVPVLQIQVPDASPTNGATSLPGSSAAGGQGNNWMQSPANTTFNLIIAAGDSPTRDSQILNGKTIPAEFNGGQPNFPTFLEEWGKGQQTPANSWASQISGSFIQFKRSAYATAPYLSLLNINPAPQTIYGNSPQNYSIGTSSGKSPYYFAPNRLWGFDVGQSLYPPDLFSQQITTPSAGDPNEFYREVSRDDPWMQTLLCAATITTNGQGQTQATTYAATDTNKPLSGSTCFSLSQYQ